MALRTPAVPEGVDRDDGARPDHQDKAAFRPSNGPSTWLVEELVAEYGKQTDADDHAYSKSEV